MDCSLPDSSVHGISQTRMPGLPLSSSGDLLNPGIEPVSPAMQEDKTLHHWATREVHTDEHRNLAPSTQTLLASFSSQSLNPSIFLFPTLLSCKKIRSLSQKILKVLYIYQNAFVLLAIISSRLTRKLNFKIVVFKYLLAIEFFDIFEILYGSLPNHLKVTQLWLHCRVRKSTVQSEFKSSWL